MFIMITLLAAIFIGAIVLIKKHDDDDSRSRFSSYMFAGVIALLTYVLFKSLITAITVCASLFIVIIFITKIIDDELNALYAIVAVYIAFLVALIYMYAWHIKV